MYYQIVYIAWENVDEKGARGKKWGAKEGKKGKKFFHRTYRKKLVFHHHHSEWERARKIGAVSMWWCVKHKRINSKKRSHDRGIDRIVIYLKLGFSDMLRENWNQKLFLTGEDKRRRFGVYLISLKFSWKNHFSPFLLSHFIIMHTNCTFLT